MLKINIEDLPKPGTFVCIQVPELNLSLGKIVENKLCDKTNIWYTLVYWVEIRRDAEWIPSCFIPTKKE